MKYRVRAVPGLFYGLCGTMDQQTMKEFNIQNGTFVQYVLNEDGHEIWDIECDVRAVTSLLLEKALTLVQTDAV